MNQRAAIAFSIFLLTNFLSSAVTYNTPLTCQFSSSFLDSDGRSPVQRGVSLVTTKGEPSDRLKTLIHPNLDDTPTLPSDLSFNITSNEGYFDGLNLFDPRGEIEYKSVIMNLEGDIIVERPYWRMVEFINSTHVLGFCSEHEAALWNVYEGTETRLGIQGHHELEYNWINNTILTFKAYVVTINETQYKYDMIEEYNLEGELVWSLDTQDIISPNQWCPFKDGFTEADITHSNSIFFDSEEDTFLFNVRNVNTFYKVDHKTGEILWGLGEYGNYSLYDSNGNPKDNLFYHAHAVEQVDDNTFILFDNDYHNQTNPTYPRSRILEITINETTMTANESWSWIAPQDYYCTYFGDADRLPNGNRLAVFGVHYGPRIVEVSEEGEIVWQQEFSSGNTIYRVERFRFEPILSSPPDIHVNSSENVNVTWQAFYNFRPKRDINGTYALYLNNSEIATGITTYDKLWRPTNLTFSVGVLEDGLYNVTLAVTDGGGHQATDSLNMTIGPFYIEREGPTTIEKGQEGEMIRWSGFTNNPLFYNITLNSTLHTSNMWDGEIITLDLDLLEEGSTRVIFRLYNGTELVHTDDFWVDVAPPILPVITPSQPNDITITWSGTQPLSWTLTDNFPSSWSLFLEGTEVTSSSWTSQTYLLNWTVPLLDEGEYNITVVASDLAGQRTINTTWLTVEFPSPPIILFMSGETQFLWGQENAILTYEIHGGVQWALWKNEVQIRGAGLSGHLLEIEIENWQPEGWSLGIHNITLEVTDSSDASSTLTLWIQIILSPGDPYADACIASHSDWYLHGDNAVGAPDNAFAEIFLDYGNGYVTLDMGAGEEILDGIGADFWVVAQGGEYNVRVSNSLTTAFITIGTGQGSQEYNLTGTGLIAARYVRITYLDGADVEVDAIVAHNYNQAGGDTEAPLITGLEDFWVLETQTTTSFIWETYDANPWNYSLYVNGSLYETGPWNGSDITLTLEITMTGAWQKQNVTLALFDVCGQQNQDSVLVDILPIDNDNPQIFGPDDFWILETQPTFSWIWTGQDLTPSNYSIFVDGIFYEAGLWDGSDIPFSYNVSRIGLLTITLTLCDFFGHQTVDTVLVEVRSLLSGPADPILKLALTVFVLGTFPVLSTLLYLTRRRK